jgi:acyl phosphate:glycerol-3-phosphate acyltransferase
VTAGPLGYVAPALLGYAFGAIPFAYIVVRLVTGEDITKHGTGNVGAMNVRRTTGSWGWFAVAMLLDALKGFAPVAITRFWLAGAMGLDVRLAMQVAVLFAIIGHDWPLSLITLTGRMVGGKGLAAGGGALLAYDWRYAIVALVTALLLIAATRILLVGQIGAAVGLPVYVALANPADLPFVLVVAVLVIYRHARRVPGLVKGKEPAWNVTDDRGRQNPG